MTTIHPLVSRLPLDQLEQSLPSPRIDASPGSPESTELQKQIEGIDAYLRVFHKDEDLPNPPEVLEYEEVNAFYQRAYVIRHGEKPPKRHEKSVKNCRRVAERLAKKSSDDGRLLAQMAESFRFQLLTNAVEELHAATQAHCEEHLQRVSESARRYLVKRQRSLESTETGIIHRRASIPSPSGTMTKAASMCRWITAFGTHLGLDFEKDPENTADAVATWLEKRRPTRLALQKAFDLSPRNALTLVVKGEEVQRSKGPTHTTVDFYGQDNEPGQDPRMGMSPKLTRRQPYHFIYKAEDELSSDEKSSPVRITTVPGEHVALAGSAKTLTHGIDFENPEAEVLAVLRSPRTKGTRTEAELMRDLAEKVPNIPEVRGLRRVSDGYCLEVELAEFDAVSFRSTGLKPATLTQAQVILISFRISQTLDAMHRLRWVHGDIKPQNILIHPKKKKTRRRRTASAASVNRMKRSRRRVSSPGYHRRKAPCERSEIDKVQLTDFGEARQIETDHGLIQTMNPRGTSVYGSPEMWTRRLMPDDTSGYFYGLKSDVYSFGAVLFWLRYGFNYVQAPFFATVDDIHELHRLREKESTVELIREYLTITQRRLSTPLQHYLDTWGEKHASLVTLLTAIGFDRLDTLIFMSLLPDAEQRPDMSSIHKSLWKLYREMQPDDPDC